MISNTAAAAVLLSPVGGGQGIVPVIPIVSRYFCAFML